MIRRFQNYVIKQKDKIVEFTLDLKMELAELAKLHGIASLIGSGLRAEMELASGAFTRHHLAWAAKNLPEKGLTDRGVLPGNYPPGAFPRSAGNAQRFLREPMQRVSWMAGLLPFLGQETLYQKINFNDSWRGSTNWVAAGTLVPQFLDPAYPAGSHFRYRAWVCRLSRPPPISSASPAWVSTPPITIRPILPMPTSAAS